MTARRLKQPGIVRSAFGEYPIRITKFPIDLLDELRGIIRFFFPASVANYISMDVDKYRKIVLLAQTEICSRDIIRRYAAGNTDLLSKLMNGGTDANLQPPRLRAVRPQVKKVQEAIGWHRELMYSPGGYGGQINIWIPIQNVCIYTALQYILDSEKIPDEDLEVEDKVDESVVSSPTGSMIGLLDVEKKIMGGVDFTAVAPMVVLPGEAAIFDGNLIHGSGVNYSNEIRFSIDSRLCFTPAVA